MPKISILIPVYNAEEYISQCLDSVVNQTMKDIEIICVLDGGKDASEDICRTYADRDNRIRIVDHQKNKGLLVARKTGVDLAEGEFIIFLDSDDWLEIDACSRLYDQIKFNRVDILQFGSYVDAEDSVPEQRVAGVKKLLEPFIGKLDGEKVFESAFLERKFGFTIWNKIYRAELCKEVYNSFSDDENIYKAEDLCAFFRLAYFAKSYIGIEDKFYHYRFGAGITGRNKIDLKTLDTYCRQVDVSEKCRQFLIEQGTFTKYRGIYEHLKKSLLNECINNWFSYLDEEDSTEGFKLLVKYWDGTDLAIALSQRWYYDSVIMLSDRIYSPDLLPRTARKINRIAIYYHRYSMGGVQKVISLLMFALKAQGYEVLLITDEEPSDTDYPLPESVERVVIPGSNKPSEYPMHAVALRDALNAFGADLVIYNATSSWNVLFDILVVKSMGIPVVLYIHEYFGVGFRYLNYLPIRKIKVYRFADVLITLSKTQRDYWRAVGSNAVYLPNPLDDIARNVKVSALNNHDIIWVGRMSKEKRYLDALDVLAKVRKVIPDARLLFVGCFLSKNDENEFYNKINSLKLMNNVIFYGYVNDVYPLYEKTSLCLITSETESFCMALAESKVAGLPCVMYKMPYLELQQDSSGIIAVNMYDTSAAAEAIIQIFTDDDLMHRLGSEARKSIEPLLNLDYGNAWKRLIEELEKLPIPKLMKDRRSNEIIINELIDAYLKGVKRYRTLESELKQISSSEIDINKLHKQLAETKKKTTDIQNSISYRLGRTITWAPRKLRGLLRCLKYKGWRSTFNLCIGYIPYVGKKSLERNKTKTLSSSKDAVSITSSNSISLSTTKKQKMLPLYEDKSKNINAISSIIEKKILLVTHQLEYTGSEHSLLRMCRVIQNHKMRAEVWSYKDGKFKHELEKMGINVSIIGPERFSSLEIQEKIKEYDLAISNTALTYSFIIAFQGIVRTIWYIREAQNLPLMLPGNNGLLKALINANNIYCVSEYARDFILANYNKNVRVLHNCVDDEYKNYISDSDSSKGKKVKFLTLGTIERRKGYDILVQAYLGLDKVFKEKSEIHFAGRIMPYDWAKRFHEPFLKEIEGKEGIFYHGEITDRSILLRLMSNSDVVVVPSRDESCSLVALEGAMMGKPLIVTENVGAKYLVNDLNGWVVRTEDEVSLRKAFIEAIDKPELLKAMGKASRIEYLKTSTYEIFEKRFIEMVIDNLQ